MLLYLAAYLFWMVPRDPRSGGDYYARFWREVLGRPVPRFWFWFDLGLTAGGAVVCVVAIVGSAPRVSFFVPTVALLLWPAKYLPDENRAVPHWGLDLLATIFGAVRLGLFALGLWP